MTAEIAFRLLNTLVLPWWALWLVAPRSRLALRAASHGAVFAALSLAYALLLELTRQGLSREAAYALVQRHAMETWDRGGDFRERILAEPGITAVLSKEEIERAFSLDEALRHVDAIFERTLALAAAEEEAS